MYNSLGIVAPVMQMAVADTASGSTSLSWSSEQVGEGLASYDRNGASAEDFDIDLREPADAGKVLGAGFMQLGNWALAYAR